MIVINACLFDIIIPQNSIYEQNSEVRNHVGALSAERKYTFWSEPSLYKLNLE